MERRLVVDPVRRDVVVDGRPVRLGGRAFDLLAVLASEPGQIFAASALEAAVWPGLVVEPTNLRVQVAQLRRAIGRDAIVSVARRGYALTLACELRAPTPSNDVPARRTRELRSSDAIAVVRLVGECCELGGDPAAWPPHLLAGLARLIDLPVGMQAEVADFGPGGRPRILAAFEHGWDDAGAERAFRTAHRERDAPFDVAPLDRAFRALADLRGDVTVTRADLLDDRAYRDDDFYDRVLRPARMHEMAYSVRQRGPDGRVHMLGFGGPGHRPTERDRTLLAFAHDLVLPLIGRQLGWRTGRASALSASQRRLLDLAVTGADNATLAVRLGVSVATVKRGLRALYAHFEVDDRVGLLARLLAERHDAGPTVAP